VKPLYFTPRVKYKSISLTGSWCALNCKFCGGKYLVNMIQVTPSSFEQTIRELYSTGVRGVLLSGGFRRNGTLPIEPYLKPLQEVKSKYKLIISAHLGLVTNQDLLSALRGLIDVVDYEFTLSPYIANQVRGYNFSVEKYLKALAKMIESRLYIVPHVYAWHPEVSRETLRSELSVLSDLGFNAVTLLVYLDPYNQYEPNKLAERALSNVEYARSVFPGELYMGCMRPGHVKPLLDPVIVERGLVDRVANPYYRVLKEYPSELFDACCSVRLSQGARELFLLAESSRRL
jgi:uncharacterized radical SAM superfamily protein